MAIQSPLLAYLNESPSLLGPMDLP